MLSYGYLVGLCALIAILNLLTRSYTATHPDRVTEVVYLIIAASGLAFVEVRLERGRLTLSALANGPAAVLLNPLDATLVGLATGFAMVRRPRWTVIANAVMTAAVTVAGSSFASLLHESTRTSLLARLAVLLVVFVASLVLVAGGLSMRTGESVQSIARHNFTPPFFLAYGYFTLASLLVTYLLDGSVIGYFLATIVFTLGVALTDTIAGRRVRRVLESELSDAGRHNVRLDLGRHRGAPLPVTLGAVGQQAQFDRPEGIDHAGRVGHHCEIGVGRRRHPALELAGTGFGNVGGLDRIAAVRRPRFAGGKPWYDCHGRDEPGLFCPRPHGEMLAESLPRHSPDFAPIFAP